MVDALILRFSPKNLGEDADYRAAKNSRLLISYLVVISGVVLFFTAFDALGDKPVSSMINFAAWLFLVGLIALYRATGAYTLAVVLLVSSCQLLLAVQHVHAPEGLYANLFWPPLLTMISVHLLGRGPGIKLGLASSLVVVTAATLRPVIAARGDAFTPDEIFRFHVISLCLTVTVALYVAGRLTAEVDQVFEHLESQKEKFFDLSETNSALLSVLGHDINNHLTALTLRLSALRRSVPEERHAELEKVEQHVSRVATIVAQTSELSAIRTGKLAIHPVAVDLGRALDESLDLFEHELSRREIDVARNMPEEGGSLEVMAEPYSLVANVLSNILSNAIKFSPDRSRLELTIEEERESALVLHVRDGGVGIPAELLAHIFDFHVPTSRPGVRGEKGMGFGMPIVKMFMERYGASVEISSGLGRGASGGMGTTVSLAFQRA